MRGGKWVFGTDVEAIAIFHRKSVVTPLVTKRLVTKRPIRMK